MAFPACALLGRLRLQHSEGTTRAFAAYAPANLAKAMIADPGLCGPRNGSFVAEAMPVGALGTLKLAGAGGAVDGVTSSVAGKVWSLSRDARGCRAVQLAFEEANDEEREALAGELRGHVVEATRCPHANHVLQKCVAVMAPRSLQFLIDEILVDGKLAPVARHKYGCRIVQRLIANCPVKQVHDLVELIMVEFLEISRHAYGNFVVQNLLLHAFGEQRERLANLIELHVSELALHSHGCAVLGAALEHGEPNARRRLAEMMLESDKQVTAMADSRHGLVIINGMLESLDGLGCDRLFAALGGHSKFEEALQRRSETACSD